VTKAQTDVRGDDSTTGRPLIQVDDLTIRYRLDGSDADAIIGMSFSIAEGESVGIVGESGCGKSTLLAAMMGLLPGNGSIAQGDIIVQGRRLTKMSEQELRAMRGAVVAPVFQDALQSLNPSLTIGQQLFGVQRAHNPGLSRGAADERSLRVLRDVGISDQLRRLRQYPHELSGGMRQRAMVAMALVVRPRLLLLDEPTASLDVTLTVQILGLLHELRAEYETAILLVSHDIGTVGRLCDRMLVLYAGQLVEEASIPEVFARPQHPYTRALLASIPGSVTRDGPLVGIPGRMPALGEKSTGCRFVGRCVDAREICSLRRPGLSPAGEARVRCLAHESSSGFADSPLIGLLPEVRAVASEPRSARSDHEVLALKDIRRVYRHRGLIRRLTPGLGRDAGAVRAVDGVSLTLREGEIVALVGESGSGKSTLSRVALRLESPDGGAVLFDGQDISAVTQRRLRPIRRDLQMIFQDPAGSLSPRRTIEQCLQEPYLIHRVPAAERRSTEDLLGMVGLDGSKRTAYPHQLSGGQARRVGIARALALRPRLLVADEPTSGLDVSVAAGIVNLLREIVDESNVALLIVTHDLGYARHLADRIAVMYLGRIVEQGPAEAVLDSPLHPYTRALVAADPIVTSSGVADPTFVLRGEIPSPIDIPSGCRFRSRCPHAEPSCADSEPMLEDAGATVVACHLWRSITDGDGPGDAVGRWSDTGADR